MIIKFDYNDFLIMDGEKLLSISHHFFLVFTCKNIIMLSVSDLASCKSKGNLIFILNI